MCGGLRLFDLLLTGLGRGMNSELLVGNDIGYLQAYTNSLALLMDQPESLMQALHFSVVRSGGSVVHAFARIVGKRLHTLSMERFLSLGPENDDDTKESRLQHWSNIFKQLITETTESGYYLVVDSLHIPFMKQNQDRYAIPAHEFFWATRGKVRLTVIAPLLWPDYAFHIEQGTIPMMSKQCKPFLFTPRPQGIPPHPTELLAPDGNFEFPTTKP